MTDINENKRRIIYIESILKKIYSQIEPEKGIDNWEEIWELENELLKLKREVFIHHGQETSVPI